MSSDSDTEALLTDEQIRLVQSTFAMVEPIADDAAVIFYNRLFELDPKLKTLFKEDMAEQRKALMSTLKVAVKGLTDLDSILPAVQQLGERHGGYGVKDEDYKTVAQALLWTLEQGLGDEFTDDVKDAWTEVYMLLAGIMTDATQSISGTNDITNQEATMLQQVSNVDTSQFKQMVEDMPINVMVCDLENFNITYANKSSVTTLKTLEHVLPIKADDLVGQCIDIFHKDPSHQRTMLANPANLPHSAIIEIGGEKLDLLVTAVNDASGNYQSAMLTWSVITEKVKKDEDTARLMQMIDNMPVNVMMCDPNTFEINYINQTSSNTLRPLQEHLPVKVDELMGQCIDVFHKNPSHQRNILGDPANLPHRGKINVGPETLDLQVTAITDKEGK
ncbi:MAG: PAS domain-containing protein, partial [Rhodospirillaceae bacterium]|nr:PAS domain-containing protein [Rhodospirillaceae bacterium]